MLALSVLGLAAVFLAGCATPQMHVTRSAPAAAAPNAKTLDVFKVGDHVDRPYEIIGVVSASGDRGGVYSKARQMILAEAAALGADALVGYYVDDEKTAPTGDADGWAGVLAVRFLPAGTPDPGPSKVVVALPHTILGEDFGTGKKAAKADAIARKHARMLLAKKGYYAVLTEDKLAPGFPDALRAPSPAERIQYGSSDAAGALAVHYATTGKTLLSLSAGTAPIGAVAFAPKADGVLAAAADGRLHHFELKNPHPEVTWRSLFGKVWYEGYARPDYVWQSTGGTDDFEAKFSLTPLVYGTLKGTFYALVQIGRAHV